MTDRRIYVETVVHGDLEALWHRTQDPAEHARWDLRFSEITHLPTPTGEPQRFRYALRLPGRTLTGVGVSVGERTRSDGSRTSALRFRADDRWSPLRSGNGYWRYVPGRDGTRFLTGYDYEPGPQGSLLDRLVVRPYVGWLTAWSFDRLRLWVDTGLEPEAAARRSVAVAASRALVAAAGVRALPLPWSAVAGVGALVAPLPLARPLARRCRRRAPDPLGTRAPSSLASLAAPPEAA